MANKLMRNLFFALALIAGFAAFINTADAAENKSCAVDKFKCEAPRFLKAGDKVALLSPAYFTSMDNVEKTVEVLRAWGLVPVVAPNVGKEYLGRYAGTVEERLSDLEWALNDPEIKAIICNRGGYGALPLVNPKLMDEIKANPKWIVGFSEITSLHGAWQNAGVMSIHGTMSSFLAKGGTDLSSTLMRDMLMGTIPSYVLPAHSQNIQGQAQGVLIGGNITTFAAAVGSLADATKNDGFILFIEEVGETMRNIDRQFNLLMNNGLLERCKGIILGEFTECGDEFILESVEAMLRQYLVRHNIPMVCGFPGGHDDVNLPLIMGADVKLDVRADGATIDFSLKGKQKVQVPINQ